MDGALFLLGTVCVLIYFIPSIAARRKRDFAAIFAVNFFLGWTLIGWVVALAWALKYEPPSARNI